jgi:ABC-type lipopolysaccharide export system ATPase subunit
MSFSDIGYGEESGSVSRATRRRFQMAASGALKPEFLLVDQAP